MPGTQRLLAFVLAASDHGTMIVNRMDRAVEDGIAYGVGHEVLDKGNHDGAEVEQVLALLALRRAHFGDGVVAVDCGANIGVHAVEWARRMTGWGEVIAIEPQEWIFYALAGNLALNNCFNARAMHAAVAASPGTMRMPVPDYRRPGSFGSLELRPSTAGDVGQPIDYSDAATVEVRTVTLDGLGLRRLDLVKIDVEGMEDEALDGGAEVIGRHLPIIVAEHIKVGWGKLESRLRPLGYQLYRAGPNLVAVHPADPCSQSVVTKPA